MIYRFGDIFYIIDGDRGVNYPKEKDFSDDGYCLFLNAGNVTKTGWSFNKVSFITKEKDSQLRKGRIERGDTVFTTRGTIGNAAYYGNSIKYDHMRINSGMVILKAKDKQIINDEFIYYLVTSPIAKKIIELFSSGSAQPQLPIKDFIKIKYDLPSLKTQKKIAFIIGSYDNLIENNNRRIHLLEQMAENLYKEWFVRFRFPGHEKVEMENGLPKGWTRGRLGDIVEFQNGFAFKSETFQEEGRYSIVTIKNVQDEGFDGSKTEKIDVIPSRMPSYCCLKEGDILLSLTGNVGRVCRVFGRNYLLNQRVAIIKAEYEYFIYSLMKTEAMFAALNTISYGTAQLNLSPIKAAQLKIIVPAKELQIAYNQKVSALFESIDKLKAQNQLLTRQRDLLLPRLMSGKLEVNA